MKTISQVHSPLSALSHVIDLVKITPLVTRVYHTKSWVSTNLVHVQVIMSAGMLPWTMVPMIKNDDVSPKKKRRHYYSIIDSIASSRPHKSRAIAVQFQQVNWYTWYMFNCWYSYISRPQKGSNDIMRIFSNYWNKTLQCMHNFLC